MHIEGTGVTYRTGCWQSGPPAVALFESGPVHFELTLDPKQFSNLGASLAIRAAPDVALTMREPIVRLRASDGRVAQVTLDPLWTTRHPDGRLATADRVQGAALYRFRLLDVPALDGGALELPTITANGAALVLPPLRFERRGHAAFAPLNC